MHQNNETEILEEVDNKERLRVKEVKTKIALSIRPSKVVNQNACFLSGNIKGSQKSKHHSISLVKIEMARRNRKEQTRRSDGGKVISDGSSSSMQRKMRLLYITLLCTGGSSGVRNGSSCGRCEVCDDSTRESMAAEVKSLLCSKLGRLRSNECRVRS